MQFSAIVNRFIVKTYLNSAFTNDLKRKENFSKNVHSCRLSLFNKVYSEAHITIRCFIHSKMCSVQRFSTGTSKIILV